MCFAHAEGSARPSLLNGIRQAVQREPTFRDLVSIEVSDYRPNWIIADYLALSETDQATFDDSHDDWVEVQEEVKAADDEHRAYVDLNRMTVWDDAVCWQATYKNADDTLESHILYKTDLERIAAGLPLHGDDSMESIGSPAKGRTRPSGVPERMSRRSLGPCRSS